ncbi:hypothetical protein SYNPS1DRAFT_28736 [Syncephalis pseudoplumigaleata]|uniref:SEC7 domain-containing protein n=1 Tax=Syncephalis pseudoplumigaleata TaxID=1712513 RepID=A0A4P9YZK6_9FUNG|nr:hypothetical protein SYNPS1DRAFT_28736 [Syncephalis pseudoplumigaleata]|eukprot:RKP25534.1 hypothetical protein SYNPS1DRAFT_28736 [Syncephalis pseudoplumigaleata]
MLDTQREQPSSSDARLAAECKEHGWLVVIRSECDKAHRPSFGQPCVSDVRSMSSALANRVINGADGSSPPLSESTPLAILTTYLKHFDFTETSIDLALRVLLLDIPLPRQPEKIDCILIAFANRFHECNPDMFSSVDVVYSVGFAMLLLHADVHGMDAQRMITFDQFASQANAIGKSRRVLYDNVLSSKFIHAGEPYGGTASKHRGTNGHAGMDGHGNLLGRFLGRHRTARGAQSNKSPQRFLQQANKARLATQLHLPGAHQYTYKPDQWEWPQAQEQLYRKRCILRVAGMKQSLASTIGHHPTEYALSLAQPLSQIDERTPTVQLTCHHQDFVMRKLDQVENGQRSGQRSWVPYWLVLTGSQLLLFSEVAWFRDMEQRAAMATGEQATTSTCHSTALPPDEIHSLKEAICIIDRAYTKYPHVVRLCLADGQQWLLRMNDEEAVAQWMLHINHAAVYRSIKLDPEPRSPADRNELRLRRNIINGHLATMTAHLAQLESELETDARLLLQLSMSVPIRRKIRDRAIATGRTLSTRLRKTYIERQQWQCYQEILGHACNTPIE